MVAGICGPDLKCGVIRVPIVPPTSDNGDVNLRLAPALPDTHEAALLAASRWSLWRTLARGLAHSLANASQMLALDPGPAGAREEARERIERATARLAATHGSPTREPVVPAEVFAELDACQSLQISWPSTPIEWAIASPLPAVACHSGDLLHALLAVVTNAKEAAAGRARIRLSVHEVGAHVEIRCEDEGPGIPEAARASAFEPAGAPRDAAHLGLGLWSARTLLRACGGDVTLGPGSLVALRVPVWHSAAAGNAAIR